MELENVDTSRFLENPKKARFVENMIKRSKVFDLNIYHVHKPKILTYLVLMYDKHSYFRTSIKNFLERKYQSAVAARFVLQEGNMFAKSVEDVLIGESNEFNRAVVEYVSLQYDLEYAKLIVYELNYYKLIQESFNKWDPKGETKKQIDALSEEIALLEERIFGGQEVMNMRKALYEGTAATRLRIRPEDMVNEFAINRLRHLSPWGNYNLDNANVVNFVGDEIPKDEN